MVRFYAHTPPNTKEVDGWNRKNGCLALAVALLQLSSSKFQDGRARKSHLPARNILDGASSGWIIRQENGVARYRSLEIAHRS